MSVPAALTERPQWVAWAYETRDGKPTKVPYSPGGGRASTTDPGTWGSFEEAQAAGLEGVGFVFSPEDPLAGVDLDDCLRDGELHPSAAALLRLLDSYTEISPSGTGFHVIVEGVVGAGRKTGRVPWGGALEVYDRGRFFTVTGGAAGAWSRDTIEPRQDALARVLALFPGGRGTDGAVWVPADDIDPGELITDGELLEDARHDPRFARLWAGDWSGYPSQSEADLALCCLLAEWTAGDRERIARLFGESGLHRPKWERASYRRPTIERAVEAAWG